MAWAIDMTIKGFAGITKRDFQGIHRVSYRATGHHWHVRYADKHFTRQGAQEYGYEPRKGEPGNPDPFGFKSSYTGRKFREKGHTNPLEFSGLSRQLARIRDVRATAKGGRIVIHARGLNRKNPHSNINMREEMTEISSNEERAMLDVFRRTQLRGIKRIRRTKKIRIR